MLQLHVSTGPRQALKWTNAAHAFHVNNMRNETGMPQEYTAAVAELTAEATAYIASIWGDAGHEITTTFFPADVARIVVKRIAPNILRQVEIAQLEAGIALANLRKAERRIEELEAAAEARR